VVRAATDAMQRAIHSANNNWALFSVLRGPCRYYIRRRFEIAANAKQGYAHHWKYPKVHIGPRFAHDFQPSVCIRLYNEIVLATSNGHTKS
jgi:hypothetical protein